MKVGGQERHDNLRLQAGDLQAMRALARRPVRQQGLGQADHVPVLQPGGLLLRAVFAVAVVDARLRAREDGAGSDQVRLMQPVAAGLGRVEVAQEEGDGEGAVEREPWRQRQHLRGRATKQRNKNVNHLLVDGE